MVRRVIAHRVVHNGTVHRLCVVDITGDGIRITPFDSETAATPFVDGTVFVLSADKPLSECCWAVSAEDAVFAVSDSIVDEWPSSPGVLRIITVR